MGQKKVSIIVKFVSGVKLHVRTFVRNILILILVGVYLNGMSFPLSFFFPIVILGVDSGMQQCVYSSSCMPQTGFLIVMCVIIILQSMYIMVYSRYTSQLPLFV